MSKKAVGIPVVLGLVGASLLLAIRIDTAAKGEQDAQPSTAVSDTAAADANPPAKKFDFVGVVECAGCHKEPNATYKLKKVDQFVNLTEFSQWMSGDKHSRSYLRIIPEKSHFEQARDGFSLVQEIVNPGNVQKEQWGESNELSAKILGKLDIDTEVFKMIADVQKAEAEFTPEQFEKVKAIQTCLSCHANWQKHEDKPDAFVFSYGIGVGCESCHGAASEWKTPHTEEVWRTVDPAQKEADYGMVNVRNPARRAKQCFSCHIGDVDQGKVVTHEMYAAGHPPLPGIEIESFATQMPRHWRYLNEKPAFKNRDEFVAHVHWDVNDLPRSKAVLLGGVAAMRDSLNLLADQAADASGKWPQFSAYDCAACHHDLKSPSVRQQAGYGNRRPGRPPLHQWTKALVDVAIVHAGADRDEYAAKMQALQAALNDKPFGERETFSSANDNSPARQLAEWLGSVATTVQDKTMDAGQAKKALQALCASDLRAVADYHSARQIAWAIRMLYGDTKDSVKNAAAFEQTLNGIAEKMRLDLPAGSTKYITDSLPEALSAINNYDPNWLLGELKKLSAAL